MVVVQLREFSKIYSKSIIQNRRYRYAAIALTFKGHSQL